jgi:UDP-N-acetylglucosamine 4,6-dehydratase
VRSVLITGGSGFFGREFVRAALAVGELERICVYSRGEHAQAAFRDALEQAGGPVKKSGRYNLHSTTHKCRWLIGDIRDRDRLRRAMEGVDLVVHAAALKRIEVGFYNPVEMVRTNVLGAVNVVEAAQDAGVARVVLLSSDKAYQPVSAYGTSKAMAESLFLAANNTTRHTRFAVCRYGNIWGSTGSVVPLWRGWPKDEPVPVTDPDCTRFYMTRAEAVRLVMDTAEAMPAEIAVPELPAYRVGDLAAAMEVPIRVTGLNAWEKRHESMCEGRSSETARRMSVAELQEALGHV